MFENMILLETFFANSQVGKTLIKKKSLSNLVEPSLGELPSTKHKGLKNEY